MQWLRNWWKQRVRLKSGDVEFTVPIGEEETEVWRSDLITLKIVAEETEILHQLDIRVDGTLSATPEFLADLAKRYESLGCPRCTPTMARNIWIVIADRFRTFDKDFRLQMLKVLR